MENTQFDVLIKATKPKNQERTLNDVSIRVLNSETIADAFKTSIVNTILKYVSKNNAFGLIGSETKDDGSVAMNFSDGSTNIIYDNTLEFVKPTDDDGNILKISFKFDDEKTSVNLESFNVKDKNTGDIYPCNSILGQLYKMSSASSLDYIDKDTIDDVTNLVILTIMKLMARNFSNFGNTKPDVRYNTF